MDGLLRRLVQQPGRSPDVERASSSISQRPDGPRGQHDHPKEQRTRQSRRPWPSPIDHRKNRRPPGHRSAVEGSRHIREPGTPPDRRFPDLLIAFADPEAYQDSNSWPTGYRAPRLRNGERRPGSAKAISASPTLAVRPDRKIPRKPLARLVADLVEADSAGLQLANVRRGELSMNQRRGRKSPPSSRSGRSQVGRAD